jgi:hypothetical protein
MLFEDTLIETLSSVLSDKEQPQLEMLLKLG